MKTWFLRSAMVAGLLALSATAGFAQTSSQNCRSEVTATGASALTLKGAQESAIKAWQRSVVLRYGELFSVWDQSSDKSVDRCGKTTFGLNRCDARGRPCQASAPGKTREISCMRDDSKECSPTVKWIQTRLNAKSNAGLKTDGGEGKNTENAIRKFKRQNNLGNNSDVDDALLAALD
jgi:Putative peptidoglycan binding domain